MATLSPTSTSVTAKPTRAEATRARSADDAYVGYVRDFKLHSERVFTAWYLKTSRWYDRYRGIYSGKFAAFRNNIHIPFIYSVIQSDVARKLQMMLGNWPLISFEGYPPEQEPIAKKNELLISAQFEDAMMYLKAADFLTTLDLYGVAIMRVGWRRDIRREKIRVPWEVAPGIILDRETTQWQNYFDGPDCYVVDPLDFFPEPGFRFIEKMNACVERYWTDLDSMRATVKTELDAGLDAKELSFDPQALSDAALMGSITDSTARAFERLSVYRNQTDYESRRATRYAKPIEVWEYWGFVPDELVPADGERFRRIVVLNGRVLAKNTGNPYWHGQKPWHSAAIGDPHYFHGVGKSELLEKMQAAANRLMNHQLDSLDLTISPTMLANSSVFPYQNLVTQPGRVWHVDGPVGPDVIQPLQQDFRGIQITPGQIENLWRYMQQGSGIIEDVVMGGGGTDRQTAREFQGRQENVMTRLMSETRQIEESWLEPIANIFRALNRQLLQLPKELNMIGTGALINPVSGAPMPQEGPGAGGSAGGGLWPQYGMNGGAMGGMPPPPQETAIIHQDLWPDYRARAVGANQTMMRAARQQNIVQLLSAMSSNPALMMQVNWVNFARQMFEVFGFRNINELLIQLPQMGSISQQLGMPPGDAASAIGSPGTLSDAHMQSMTPQTQLSPLQPLT